MIVTFLLWRVVKPSSAQHSVLQFTVEFLHTSGIMDDDDVIGMFELDVGVTVPTVLIADVIIFFAVVVAAGVAAVVSSGSTVTAVVASIAVVAVTSVVASTDGDASIVGEASWANDDVIHARSNKMVAKM